MNDTKQTRTIRLLGVLGKKFGRLHELAVDSPAEAIRALCVLHDGFKEFLETSHHHGIGYKFSVGSAPMNRDTLNDEVRMNHSMNTTFTLAPVVMGGKSGLGQILIGIAIVVASVYFAPAGALLGSTTAYSAVVGIGISMILGGVTQMLSPQPKGDKPKEEAKNEPSYMFNGAVNTTAQGHPVPILYGRLRIGSAVVSAGITPNEIPYIAPVVAAQSGVSGVFGSVVDSYGNDGGGGDGGGGFAGDAGDAGK